MSSNHNNKSSTIFVEPFIVLALCDVTVGRCLKGKSFGFNLDSFDHDFVRNTVYSMKGLMVYSHTISLAKSATVGGAPYSWEEVTPGSDKDTLPWEVFLKACKDIGYNGYLSHEQCSPIIVKGHKLGTLETIDQRYVDAHRYFRGLLEKLDCYSGHKAV